MGGWRKDPTTAGAADATTLGRSVGRSKERNSLEEIDVQVFPIRGSFLLFWS